MATTKVDVKKILENRLAVMDDELQNLKPGSDEYSRLLNNICNVTEKLTSMKQAADTAEDNAAKREETKRVNDEELRIKNEELNIKQAQLENDTVRVFNEREAREKQMTGNFIIDGLRVLCAWAGMAAYEHRYHRVMGMEYAMSDGTSVTPPNNVQRILAEGKPKSNI